MGSEEARIQQVKNLVTTVDTVVDTLNTKVGTNVDAGGTTTMFARLGQIAGYTDTLEGNLGSNSDASSASGSVHAKLKDIKTAVGSPIKSIQRGTIAFSDSKTSNTATIAAVDTAKTVLNFLGASAGGTHSMDNVGDVYGWAETAHHFFRLVLTNATTITATRSADNDVAAEVSYEVIEYN